MTSARNTRGFTLVELLVVIGIIGLLAALLTPVVMQSLAKARNAAIKAEIDMLHMAIMNYKNEYGSFPPALDTALNASTPAGKHLTRLFSRCPSANIPLQLAAPFASPPFSGLAPQITGTNALVYWLYGYTNDPTSPLTPASDRKILYDFDRSRISASGAYAPSGKDNSPYLYVNSAIYTAAGIPYAGGSSPVPGAMRMTAPTDPNPFGNPTYEFFNKDTFQILCAGRDEVFGTDDDLSNFWPGTRREFLDSLKD